MNEREVLRVFTRLDIDYTQEVNGWLMAHCPFATWYHEGGYDRSGDFGVSYHDEGDPSYYHCFACKRKGDLAGLAFKLAQLREEPELVAYGKQIQQDEMLGGSDDFGEWGEVQNDKKKKTYRIAEFPSERRFRARFPSVLYSRPALAYLARRRIFVSTAVALGLRYDAVQQRILFPVYDYYTGRYAGCSGRTIHSDRECRRIEQSTGRQYPKVRDYGGLEKRRVLLGKNGSRARSRDGGFSSLRGTAAADASPSSTIVCEGLFAYARLVQHGFGDVAYALLGSEVTVEKAEILKDIGLPIYWFVDNDKAGRMALFGHWDKENEVFEGGGGLDLLYGHVAQFIPTWPDGKDDPDDLTKGEVETMIEDAEFYIKPSEGRKSRHSR